MKRKPNFVFILSDDQGAWALNCAGTEELHTPNINRIAENGIRFENFFCTSPVCSPARASILTGTMPSFHGIQDWLKGGNINMEDFPELRDNPVYSSEKNAIPYLEGIMTYTDILAENGYDCALCGKWHMGDSVHPQHGFSHWYTIARGGCRYYHPDVVENGRIEFKNEYITSLITDDALACLDEMLEKDTPFYLSVHYTAPHSPWNPENHPKEFLDLYKDCSFPSVANEPVHPWLTPAAPYKPGEAGRRENLSGYFAAITAMDYQIGRIFDKLEKNNALEDTVIIFTSDNGMSMGHHGIWGKGNGTFPQNMYDSAIKVPFVISWKNHFASNCVKKELCSHYDILPTILDLAGLDIPSSSHHLPGISLRDLFENRVSVKERPVVVFDEYGPVRMIRTEDWKLVVRIPYGPDELYDLKNDPGEKFNLYGVEKFDSIEKELRLKLFRWFSHYSDSDKDASHEANTGYGQLSRVGTERDLNNSFAAEQSYRKFIADFTSNMPKPLETQP